MVKKLRYVFDRKDKMKLVGLAILMIMEAFWNFWQLQYLIHLLKF